MMATCITTCSGILNVLSRNRVYIILPYVLAYAREPPTRNIVNLARMRTAMKTKQQMPESAGNSMSSCIFTSPIAVSVVFEDQRVESVQSFG